MASCSDAKTYSQMETTRASEDAGKRDGPGVRACSRSLSFRGRCQLPRRVHSKVGDWNRRVHRRILVAAMKPKTQRKPSKHFYIIELLSKQSANLSLNRDMRKKISVSVKLGNLQTKPPPPFKL
jgi:hypothetical protein